MNKSFKILGLACVAACALSLSVQAQTATYQGNGRSDFDGAVGNGILTFSSNGTTLTGTITNGNTTSGFNDTLVIYIDSVAGGFTSTGALADSGGGDDNLRSAISGFNSVTSSRSTLNFATGFGADYALAVGPASANFGALFTLNSATNFTYGSDGTNGALNLAPTGTNSSATYTFSLPLSLIGSPTSFQFVTTYLNGGTRVDPNTQARDIVYRSTEGYANTITDLTNPGNTGSIGTDTALATFTTFPVPEPSTWAAVLGGAVLLVGWQRRARRA